MQGLVRRGLTAAIATLAVTWPLAAIAQSTPTTLRAVMHSDLKVIDPIWVSAQIARTHGYLVYDTLFALDADMKAQPQMVDSYKVSDDKLTYTFVLRDGLQWHDGKPVLAADCVQSIKRWAERDGDGQRLMQATKDLEADDDKTFRLNWLHPPFDNPKIREAAGYAIDQKPFLDAQVGDEKFYQVCKAYFICGTPLATMEGMDGRLEGNVAKARELLKEAGYDGTPVVLMRTTDLAALVNLAPVAKAQLEKAGFKVDMQSADWQTTVSRTNKRDAPANGGWNLFLTSWGALDSSNPIVSQNLNASCEKATPGWPCDKKLEELRDQFARAPDLEQQKKIATEIQVRAATLGTHYPLGEWYGMMVHRTNSKGWLPPMSAMLFWNAEKTGP